MSVFNEIRDGGMIQILVLKYSFMQYLYFRVFLQYLYMKVTYSIYLTKISKYFQLPFKYIPSTFVVLLRDLEWVRI